MSSFIPGKLYKCPSRFLLLFPTKEKAVLTRRSGTVRGGLEGRVRSYAEAKALAEYWSKRFNCAIRLSKPDDNLLFLKEETIDITNTNIDESTHFCHFYQFLVSDFTGWITYLPRMNFVKIV